MKYIIEIATSDFLTTKSAVEGGADRIELCANLAEGGTTPSYGHIKKCREAFDVLIYPIIRPRGGDFLFTDEEFEIMLHDVKLCKQLGCDGVVVGLLNSDGSIDIKRTSQLVEAAYPLGVTFHRAFDRCKDPIEAMEQLIQIGCERILTSGPGSGVRKENIKMLAQQTGCVEFHSSLRGKKQSQMEYVHPHFANSEESYMNNAIDANEVKAFRNALS
jgi:copper homeostasis protein